MAPISARKEDENHGGGGRKKKEDEKRSFDIVFRGGEGEAGQYIDRGLFPRFLDGWGLVELVWTRPQVEKCGKQAITTTS